MGSPARAGEACPPARQVPHTSGHGTAISWSNQAIARCILRAIRPTAGQVLYHSAAKTKTGEEALSNYVGIVNRLRKDYL